MTRQTMVTQIVTMTTAGMVNRKDIPESSEGFLNKIKQSCAALMAEPPTDDEMKTAFASGMPVEFSEIIANI